MMLSEASFIFFLDASSLACSCGAWSFIIACIAARSCNAVSTDDADVPSLFFSASFKLVSLGKRRGRGMRKRPTSCHPGVRQAGVGGGYDTIR